ncbi:hypothetical protein ACGFIY_21125 [Micromonospora chersina]|uniref:hypothetical protein n=1 Tax=Micromonospora chersina TaxID=47854 RepID=UPI0037225EA7
MITHIARRDGFDGLTIRDERGSSLVIERTSDKTQVWIAPPGENDGPGVAVSDPDRQTIADFLTDNRDASRTWYATPEPNVDAVRDRFRRVWVRSTYATGPNLWWQGERGAGRPVTWHELLGDCGPLTEVVEAVNAR